MIEDLILLAEKQNFELAIKGKDGVLYFSVIGSQYNAALDMKIFEEGENVIVYEGLRDGGMELMGSMTMIDFINFKGKQRL